MARPRLHAVPEGALRAVVYVRQSIAREESISLGVQEQACRDYAARQGYEVAAVVADPGVSGLKWDRRAGVQRVMRMVEAHEVEVVLVWRWSRLSRRRLHQAVALDTIERAGARVESATEPFDTTTAGGEFGRDVLLAAAHFESRQKGEQWREAHQRRRDAGLPHGGGHRLGYTYTGKSYTIDPATAPIVRELYRRSTHGEGLRPLAAWLNSMGVVSPRTGRQWTARGVAYLMRTGFAAGHLHVHDPDCRCGRPASCVNRVHVPGAQDPIITAKAWRAWQRAAQQRADTPPRLRAPRTPLSGLVRCAGCGYGMRLKSDKRYGPAYLFACEHEDCTSRGTVTRARAEAKVTDWLAERVDALESAAARAGVESESRTVKRAERAHLARVVNDVQQAITRLTKDRARGLVPDTAYRDALAELETERDTAAHALDRITDPTPPLTRRQVVGLLAEWDTLAVQARHAMLARLLTVEVTRRDGKHARLRVVPAV